MLEPELDDEDKQLPDQCEPVLNEEIGWGCDKIKLEVLGQAVQDQIYEILILK